MDPNHVLIGGKDSFGGGEGGGHRGAAENLKGQHNQVEHGAQKSGQDGSPCIRELTAQHVQLMGEGDAA